MNARMVAAGLCAGLLLLGISGCDRGTQEVSFPAGTTMERLNKAGKITVGVKFDQPGLGFRNPATGEVEGFDIEMAKILAAELGLTPDDIEFVQAVSADREPFLESGRVDIVIASYSITERRRQRVGQAGPYYVTGQQVLVREEDKTKITGPDALRGVKVCSVKESTSVVTWRQKYGVEPVALKTYTQCVQRLLNKSVDAVTTDGAVLRGYEAEQSDKLEVVGPAISEEKYGIGYRKGDRAFCEFLTDTIEKAVANGAWEKAFRSTLGKSGAELPPRPTPEPC
jgi:glutamate transport system substrate-binding protein